MTLAPLNKPRALSLVDPHLFPTLTLQNTSKFKLTQKVLLSVIGSDSRMNTIDYVTGRLRILAA